MNQVALQPRILQQDPYLHSLVGSAKPLTPHWDEDPEHAQASSNARLNRMYEDISDVGVP